VHARTLSFFDESEPAQAAAATVVIAIASPAGEATTTYVDGRVKRDTSGGGGAFDDLPSASPHAVFF
jgi:hypothetical protein